MGLGVSWADACAVATRAPYTAAKHAAGRIGLARPSGGGAARAHQPGSRTHPIVKPGRRPPESALSPLSRCPLSIEEFNDADHARTGPGAPVDGHAGARTLRWRGSRALDPGATDRADYRAAQPGVRPAGRRRPDDFRGVHAGGGSASPAPWVGAPPPPSGLTLRRTVVTPGASSLNWRSRRAAWSRTVGTPLVHNTAIIARMELRVRDTTNHRRCGPGPASRSMIGDLEHG